MVTTVASDARGGEVAWVPYYLRDLEADFVRFYGVWDMLALPGALWLRMASRVAVYGGVMKVRAEAAWERVEARREPARAVGGVESRTPSGDVVREHDGSAEGLASSPMSDLFEVTAP